MKEHVTTSEPKKLVISISDAQIKDLRERLARTRWPDQLEGIDWEYGMSKTYLKVSNLKQRHSVMPHSGMVFRILQQYHFCGKEA
jgi:hypothetical protein